MPRIACVCGGSDPARLDSKTSSGKIQRHVTREAFLNGSLQLVGEHVASEAVRTLATPLTRAALLALAPQARQERLERYLREQVAQLIGSRLSI